MKELRFSGFANLHISYLSWTKKHKNDKCLRESAVRLGGFGALTLLETPERALLTESILAPWHFPWQLGAFFSPPQSSAVVRQRLSPPGHSRKPSL